MRNTFKLAFATFVFLFTQSLSAQSNLENEVFDYLKDSDDNFNLALVDFQNTLETDSYVSRGIEHKYLNQTWEGVPIFSKILSVAKKDDKLFYASHDFLSLEKFTKTSFTEALDPSLVLNQAQEIIGVNYAPEFQILETVNPYKMVGESPLNIESIYLEKLM